MTRDEAVCRGITSARTVALTDDVLQCLVECEYRGDGRCGPFSFDPQTENCIARANAKAESAMLQRCAGFACPECYQSGSCRSFTANQFAAVESFATTATGVIYCDDAFSPDGLSPAERKCRDGAVKVGRRYGRSLSKCVDRCVRAVDAGKIVDPAACELDRVGAADFDAGTRACIERAKERLTAQCDAKCTDKPDCLTLTCGQLAAVLEQQLFDFGDQLYCVDQPPPVCGDGRMTQSEVCDGSATPTGCPEDYTCSGCSFCRAPFCGDGRVTTGEQCDGAAGTCGAGTRCNGFCQCQADPCAAAAQAPTGGGTLVGTTSGSSLYDGTCSGGGPETVFRWTPAASGTATVDTCNANSFFHTVVYVRQGSCQGAEITCADHSAPATCQSNHQGRATFSVVAGQTYYIFIDSWGGEAGSFRAQLTAPGGASPSGAFVR